MSQEAALETFFAFHNIPAVINAACAPCRFVVHFFQSALPDIADIQVARLPVKGKAPGVAQPVRPYFRPPAALRKGVVRRDAVWIAAVHVDA